VNAGAAGVELVEEIKNKPSRALKLKVTVTNQGVNDASSASALLVLLLLLPI
jgi:hypothetical protein